MAPIRFIANCIVAGTNTSALREVDHGCKRRLTVEADALVNVKIEITCLLDSSVGSRYTKQLEVAWDPEFNMNAPSPFPLI